MIPTEEAVLFALWVAALPSNCIVCLHRGRFPSRSELATFRGEMGVIKKERYGKLMSERRDLDVEVKVMWER